MGLWDIILILALLALVYIITRCTTRAPERKPFQVVSTLSVYLPGVNNHEMQESMKKKKKKKLKKVKEENPILEIPQEEESEEELITVGVVEETKVESPQEVQEEETVKETVESHDEAILMELQMIRSYFLNDLKQIIPYNKNSMGSYEIQLTDNYGSSWKSSIVFVWKYNRNYPFGGLDIEMKQSAYLTRLDSDLIKEEVERLKQGKELGENPLFQMLTRTFRRIIELGRPIEAQKEESIEVETKIRREESWVSELQGKVYESFDQSQLKKEKEKQQQKQKEEKKPQLQTLVNQMFFYPHDLIEAPQWGDTSQVQQIKPQKLSTQMRYKKQFQEIKKIGQGGFGRVYLAKNKFDENIYAVKKILLNETNSKYKKTIKEVTLLSQLNHPNIVRYHQSWTEEMNSIEELVNEFEFEDQEQQEIEEQFKKWKDDRVEIEFADSERNEDTDSLEDELDRMQDLSVSSQGIVFGNNESVASITKRKKSHQVRDRQRESESDDDDSEDEKSHFPFKILYIAMEYCGEHTLKDWIDRMKTKNKKSLEQQRTYLFREILEALVYIHDRKIIHRDLKPPNIFWDEKNNRIKLGDFGVATNLNEDKFHIMKKDASEDRIDISDKTKGVGTPIYRAPEQLESGRYNEKADIFSLGIILFEMNHTFSTKMERQQTLLQLKSGVFPAEFKNIEGRKLIKSLLSKNPADRPSARSLLLSVRNNYFGQIVSTITNPKHFQFKELMTCIFKIQNHLTKTFQYQAFNHLDYKHLETIFKCHGGSNLHLSPIIPVQDFTVTNGVRVKKKREGKFLIISHEGVVLELCDNAYQPWIIWLFDTLSKNPPKRVPCIRRYSFAETVSQDDGIFIQKRTGVYDLIYPVSYTSLPLEYQCEVIRMSMETNTSSEDPVVIISHSQLICLFCEQNSVNQELLYGILHSENFKKYQGMSYEKRLEELKKYDLEQALCHKILTVLDIKAPDLEEFHKQLKQSLLKSHFQVILTHLYDLIKLLNLMDVHHFEFIVGIPPQHCKGIFWTTDRVRGFASIQTFQKEQIGTLHVEIDLKHIPRPMPDVYVWSVGEYLQKEIMEIVVKCWDAGLHTEWSKSPKGEKVENVKIGITLKRGQKRVMILIKNYETAKDIVDWIPKQNFSVDLIFNLLKNESNRMALQSKESKGKE